MKKAKEVLSGSVYRLNMKRAYYIATTIALLSGCSNQTSWSDSYNLRRWERSYLSAETFYLGKHYEAARDAYIDALTYAAKLRPDPCRLSDTLARTGNCAVMLNDESTAQECFERGVRILKDGLQNDPANKDASTQRELLAYNLGRLGALHHKNRTLNQAQKELNDALETYQRLGVTNPTANINQLMLGDYADTLALSIHNALDLNRIEDARKLYQQTLLPQLSTVFSPAVIDSINRDYSAALTKTGHVDEAGDVLSASEWRNQFMLAVEATKSNPVLAEKLCRDALAIAKRTKNSFFMAVTYAGLGNAMAYQGKFADSQNSYQQAIDAWSASNPNTNQITDNLMAHWASVSVFAPLGEIEPTFNRWLTTRTELYGAKSELTGEVLATMALVYDFNNDHDKSADFASRAFAVLKNAECEEHAIMFATQALGDLLLCRGKYDEAALLYQHLLDANKASHHDARLNDVELYLRIAAVNHCKGQGDQFKSDEAMANQILMHQHNLPNAIYFIAKSLGYLLSDLQRHNRTEASGVIAEFMQKVMAIAPPESEREHHSQQIALSALDSFKNNTPPKINRIIIRVQPGTLESTFLRK